jgi:hypothetical protein
MASATLRRKVQLLRAEIARQKAPAHPLLDRLRQDPARILTLGGMRADPWQNEVMRSAASRILLLCSRQSGKSTVAAALALAAALLQPRSLVLLLSPTERQSGELFKDKVLPLYGALGRPVPAVQESALRISVQAALQVRRLRIAPALREVRTLTKELQTFRVKVNLATANESFEAWRERDHDDLVLAVALAVWLAERPLRQMWVG